MKSYPECGTMSTVHSELLEEVENLLRRLDDEHVKKLTKWAKEEFDVEIMGD